MEEEKRLLVYGFGNPGRQDDSLGVRFADRCERIFSDRPGLHVETNYQLNIEDAYLISGFQRVIFADAALAGTLPEGSEIEAGDEEAGFFFYRIRPAGTISFSTHAMEPASILGLCDELYGRVPPCHVIRITGQAWGFDAEPTDRALRNLENAWKYFESRADLLLSTNYTGFTVDKIN